LDDGSQPSWLARASRLGHALENGLLVVLLSFLVVFSSAQIVLRNVFSIGVTWGDDPREAVAQIGRAHV